MFSFEMQHLFGTVLHGYKTAAVLKILKLKRSPKAVRILKCVDVR